MIIRIIILLSKMPIFKNNFVNKLITLLLIINSSPFNVPNNNGNKIILVLSANPAIAINRKEKYNLKPRYSWKILI